MSNPSEATSNSGGPSETLTLRIIGVGGAGVNVAGNLAAAGLPGMKFIVADTDLQTLAQTPIAYRIQLGCKTHRGLGTGGQPELGWTAAEKTVDELRAVCQDANLVLVVAGLGGGTGSGAAPVVARVASEAGALVLAFAILPFDCEGVRRQRQAQSALEQLRAVADGVICLPNQRVFQMIDEHTSLVEAFKIANDFLAQGVRSLWRLSTQPGLMTVGFNHLFAMLHGQHSQGALATAAASGSNRAREIVDRLLAHPMIDGNQSLAQADTVLVSLVGSADLTLTETNTVMEQIGRHCENAHLTLGAAIDPNVASRLEVTLIASHPRPASASPASPASAVVAAPAKSTPALTAPKEASAADATTDAPTVDNSVENSEEFFQTPRPTATSPSLLPPPPPLTPEKAEQVIKHQGGSARMKKAAARFRQGQLPLEIHSKGRFEKSEPTVHHGENLDVPTYMRRGVALN